jgi:ribosome biogenesis GTPase A
MGDATSFETRKAAIRTVLGRLATTADAAGLPSTARDIREQRLPKLDSERLSLVVLGEFNHGKSTLINALLGQDLLPVGVTPTTAVLSQVSWGEATRAEAVFESGQRKAIDPARLGDWLTVAAEAATRAGSDRLDQVAITCPAPILRDGVTIVDTPGVNDINEQRADITYGYIPRADAVLFLLDATQILSASERQFLEERILRTSRDRLVFVVAKADLLDEAELAEAIAFARQHLAGIVPEPVVLPVSAKSARRGAGGAGIDALGKHLEASLGASRRRLLLDHALADAGRASAFVRQSLGMRRRSLELPLPELTERVARAEARLSSGKRALDEAQTTIRAETAALKARVRQDLAAFTERFSAALPAEIDAVAAGQDVQRYLGGFIQDTWKRWIEREAAMMARELEALAERVIEVANENAAEVTRAVADELGAKDGPAPALRISVDTFKYDASVFAIGALGTTVFLFVNTLAGGLLALAAPIAAMLLTGRISAEIKAEARQRAPESVRKVAGVVGPRLDEIVDAFAGRLDAFIAEAGSALARGIAEVLDRALRERRAQAETATTGDEARAIDAALGELKVIDEQLAELRQRVWEG